MNILGDSISYCGLDASEPMIQLSKTKQSKLNLKNISFQKYDVTDTKIDELFDDDTVKIPICVYNTVVSFQFQKENNFLKI